MPKYPYHYLCPKCVYLILYKYIYIYMHRCCWGQKTSLHLMPLLPFISLILQTLVSHSATVSFWKAILFSVSWLVLNSPNSLFVPITSVPYDSCCTICQPDHTKEDSSSNALSLYSPHHYNPHKKRISDKLYSIFPLLTFSQKGRIIHIYHVVTLGQGHSIIL